MKKAIWILFVTLTLVWTGGAFLAAGLARWTADAIESARLAETTRHVALSSERMTRALTDTTDRVTEQIAESVAQAVGEAQQPIDGSPGAPTAPAESAPILPPLPAWVNQWMAPEMVQSIEEWGNWAKSAANVGTSAVADAAHDSARALPEAARQAASPSTAIMADAGGQAPKAAAWLADLVGWLVPIVWVIWGIGLILGLLLTLMAQWGVSRWMAAHA